MSRRKNQPELHYYFDNPNTPKQLQKKLLEMCVDNMIKIVSKYPPDLRKDIIDGLSTIISKDEISIVDLALCDANKFEAKFDED